MGTALRRRNVVDETVRIFLIGIVVLHRNLNENAVSFSLAVDDVRVERRFALVQVADKLFDTALVVECFSTTGSVRRSRRTMRSPLVRNAVSRSLVFKTS